MRHAWRGRRARRRLEPHQPLAQRGILRAELAKLSGLALLDACELLREAAHVGLELGLGATSARKEICRHRLQANHRRCEGVNAGNRRRKVRGDRTDTAGWVRAHGHAQGPPGVAHSLQRRKFGPRATSSNRARRHLIIFEAKGVGEMGAFRFCLDANAPLLRPGGDARDEHSQLLCRHRLKTFSGEALRVQGDSPHM